MRTLPLAIFVLVIFVLVIGNAGLLHAQAPAAGAQPPSGAAQTGATQTGATQTPAARAPEEAAPQPPPLRNGWQILDLSGFAAYYSHSLGAVQPGLGQLPSDEAAGGSARFGWMSSTERSSFSLIYNPSYVGRIRFSELNSLNHAASLSAITRPAPRWTLAFSVNGDYSTLDQFLFAPTAFSAAVSAPGQFSDLASAVLAGRFNNSQLASIFTSAPTAQSPIRSLLYGQRMFTVGGQMSATYSYSPRLSLTFTGRGNRNQNAGDKSSNRSGYLVAATTTGSGIATLSYSLSPLTQIGGMLITTRTSSSVFESFTATPVFTVGRTFARRWLLQGRAGVGVIKPLGKFAAGSPSTTAKPVGGGSIGFRTFAHTFLGSFDRAVSDSYGVGASANSSSAGTWRWRRPGNSWWLEAGGGWDKLQGGVSNNISAWRTSASMGRQIGQQTTVVTQYIYARYYAGANLPFYNVGQSAVRVSVLWSPVPLNAR